MGLIMDVAADRISGSPASLFERISGAWSTWRAERARRLQLLRELESLSPRELTEFAICRSDFPAIMRGTYRP